MQYIQLENLRTPSLYRIFVIEKGSLNVSISILSRLYTDCRGSGNSKDKKKKKSNLKIKKQFRVDSCEQFQSTESLISLHSSNVLF